MRLPTQSHLIPDELWLAARILERHSALAGPRDIALEAIDAYKGYRDGYDRLADDEDSVETAVNDAIEHCARIINGDNALANGEAARLILDDTHFAETVARFPAEMLADPIVDQAIALIRRYTTPPEGNPLTRALPAVANGAFTPPSYDQGNSAGEVVPCGDCESTGRNCAAHGGGTFAQRAEAAREGYGIGRQSVHIPEDIPDHGDPT